MFDNLMKKIPKLAKQAVLTAEENLKTENGKTKKNEAVKFVIEHLPVANCLKSILGTLLSVVIDSAIEIAVAFMNMEKPDYNNEV